MMFVCVGFGFIVIGSFVVMKMCLISIGVDVW